jgi:hypothetical protein
MIELFIIAGFPSASILRIQSGDPRWQLQCRSKQCELLCKSKILLRYWSHTWQKKSNKRNQGFDTLNPQPVQSFSAPHYTKKTGGFP